MRIGKIGVKNYRSLRDASTTFNNIIALLGRNNSGKSSVLQAINNFYTPEANTTNEDYYNGNVNEPIDITIEFTDLTAEEVVEFSSYIQDNRLVIQKVIRWDTANAKPIEEYYSYMRQIPAFSEIRKIEGAIEKRRALTDLIAQGTFPDLDGKPTNLKMVNDIMGGYEATHPDYLELMKTKGTFLGARNVGGGSLDKYTKFLFLPAVKEASEETEGKRSSVDQLVDLIVREKLENRDDLRKFRKAVERLTNKKYSPENLGELDAISKEMSAVLGRYSPGSEIRLNWDKPEPPEFPLPSVACRIFEDNFEGDVSRKGHGLQRAIILTLLEHLTLIKAKVAQQSASGQSPTRIDTILAIEEPELYLHPSRCRYFSGILLRLAKPVQTAAESRTQVVYTTHSPYFVGLERFDDLRLCRKKKQEGAAPGTEICLFTIDKAAERFVEVCEGKTYRDPVSNFRIRSITVMDTIMNEGFFADFLVIVEGQSDLGVLWKLQEIMKKEWDKKSIAILTTGGKGGIINSKIIFDGLNIPNYLIFDKDRGNERQNRRILKLLNRPETTLPAEKIFDDWAYNHFNLENEVEQELTSAVYVDIWDEIKRELDCDDDRIDKNPEAWARFTQITYDRKLRLTHFEGIIEKIDALHKKKTV